MASKLHQTSDGRLMFHCPACGFSHGVPVTTIPHPYGPGGWEFNGDFEKPTLNPSLLVRYTVPVTDEEAEQILAGKKHTPIPGVCHFFVREGKIQYLNDCTHSMKGQTIEMEDAD